MSEGRLDSQNCTGSLSPAGHSASSHRGHFPSDWATLKVLFLVRELIEPKARDIDHVAARRKSALNAFALFFEDRRRPVEPRTHTRPRTWAPRPRTWEQCGCLLRLRRAGQRRPCQERTAARAASRMTSVTTPGRVMRDR